MGDGTKQDTPSGQYFTAEQSKKIIAELERRGAGRPCSRCGKDQFSLTDGLFTHTVGTGKGPLLGGPAIPTIVVICKHCGAVYEHALGVLGLFEDFGFTIP